MIERQIVLAGKYIRLEEVQPKYFSYIIEWRNNPDNNRFLNQSFELTMELQMKWYEEKYLKDMTQGLFIMIDKAKDIPFGTIGWTDYDSEKSSCIMGRALVGDWNYRATKELIEGYLVFQDFLHDQMRVKISYIHVVNENFKVISLNKRWGYTINTGTIQFPQELSVNGMRQTEYVRTYEQYQKARSKIIKILEMM